MGRMLFNERMPCSSKVSSTTIAVACSVYCSWSMHFISPTTNHLKRTNKVCARAPFKNEATCVTLNAVVRIRSGSTMQPGTRVSKRVPGFGYSFEYPGYPFRALLQYCCLRGYTSHVTSQMRCTLCKSTLFATKGCSSLTIAGVI
jgi:hypothetical protein